MAKKYENALAFNNGIRLDGQTPLDDRQVWESRSDLYVDSDDPSAAPMFNKAYVGMQITVLGEDGEPALYVCKDDAPYTPGYSGGSVDGGNWLDYWRQIEREMTVHITSDIDPSINKLETYAKTTAIDNKGGVSIKASEKDYPVTGGGTVTGVHYDVSVNVDRDTIKVVDDKVAAGKYEVEALSAPTDALKYSKSYQMSYKKPDSGEYVKFGPTIDIPNELFRSSTDPKYAMLTSHGNLAESTTIEDLKKRTVSDILESILFETAVPKFQSAASLTIAWKGESAFRNPVEVGHPLPQETEFSYSYSPEVWRWTSSDGRKHGDTRLSKETSHDYHKAEARGTSGGTTAWTGAAKFGENGYYYVTLAYAGNSDALDSQNKNAGKDGKVYQAKKSGSMASSNYLTFVGGYKIRSNASQTSTDGTAMYAGKDSQPSGGFKGNSAADESGFLVTQTSSFYAKWPSGTLPSDQFYVYVPQEFAVSYVRGANPTRTNVWDVPLAFSNAGAYSATNSYGQTVKFDKWSVAKAPGITTAEIRITKK